MRQHSCCARATCIRAGYGQPDLGVHLSGHTAGGQGLGAAHREGQRRQVSLHAGPLLPSNCRHGPTGVGHRSFRQAGEQSAQSRVGALRRRLLGRPPRLRQHGVDGRDEQALRDADRHARDHGRRHVGRRARRQQARGGPQREGGHERAPAAPALRGPAARHLRERRQPFRRIALWRGGRAPPPACLCCLCAYCARRS